jgi:hypothetical protein
VSLGRRNVRAGAMRPYTASNATYLRTRPDSCLETGVLYGQGAIRRCLDMVEIVFHNSWLHHIHANGSCSQVDEALEHLQEQKVMSWHRDDTSCELSQACR